MYIQPPTYTKIRAMNNVTSFQGNLWSSFMIITACCGASGIHFNTATNGRTYSCQHLEFWIRPNTIVSCTQVPDNIKIDS